VEEREKKNQNGVKLDGITMNAPPREEKDPEKNLMRW
jgi:hypothetical protein